MCLEKRYPAVGVGYLFKAFQLKELGG